MNTNTQQSNNKIIDINNMCEQINLLDLGTIPELEAVNRLESPVEEIIPDANMDSLIKAQDETIIALNPSLSLYNNEDEDEDEAAGNQKIPRKCLKIIHEHPIPEPMDIRASEGETSEKWMYSCCAGCVFTDGQFPLKYCSRAYPDRDIESYSDKEEEIDEYDPSRMFRRDTVDDENEMELWILEQEARRRYPRRRTLLPRVEEIAVRLFEEEEVIMPVLEDEEALPEMRVLQRQNTQFTVNGVTVYNGNPNGSRFFDKDSL
jgi:hypothetical protein